jgi:hypothetical protein
LGVNDSRFMDDEVAERLKRMESTIAHLEHLTERLNEVVTEQGRELGPVEKEISGAGTKPRNDRTGTNSIDERKATALRVGGRAFQCRVQISKCRMRANWRGDAAYFLEWA